MALTNITTINKRVKERDIDCLYYFYGRDTAALENYVTALENKLCPKDARVMNYHKFDGEKLDITEFNDACMSLPMFAERVVITVVGLNMEKISKSDGDDLRKIIKNLDKSTTSVILTSVGEEIYKNKKYLTDKNKRFADTCEKIGSVVEFGYKRPAELGKSIIAAMAKRGCRISPQNGEYLAQLCLCDSGFILQEIEKLSAYAQNREVTRADIDLLCIRRIESDGYSLALNVLNGNADFVFNRLNELYAQNYEAFEIVGIIGFSLSDIYRAKLARNSGVSYSQAAADFGYAKNREFAMKNAYNECGSFSVKKIRETINILSETDYTLKTHSAGKSSDMLTLEQGLARAMALRC